MIRQLASSASLLCALLASVSPVLGQGRALGEEESLALQAIVRHMYSWGDIKVDGCSLLEAAGGSPDLSSLSTRLGFMVDRLEDPCGVERNSPILVRTSKLASFEFQDSMATARALRWWAGDSYTTSRLIVVPNRRGVWSVSRVDSIGEGSIYPVFPPTGSASMTAAVQAVLELTAAGTRMDVGSVQHRYEPTLLPGPRFPPPSPEKCEESRESWGFIYEAYGWTQECNVRGATLEVLGIQEGDFVAALACLREHLDVEGAMIGSLPETDCQPSSGPVLMVATPKPEELGRWSYAVHVVDGLSVSLIRVLVNSDESVETVELLGRIRPAGR